MNRFRRSRVRVSLEILCTLTVSLSLAGAWLQTGAWALLPASLALLLGAIILAADLGRGAQPPAVQPQQIDFDSGLATNTAELANDTPADAGERQSGQLPEEKTVPDTSASRGKGQGRPRKPGASKKQSPAKPRAAPEVVEAPPAASAAPVSSDPLSPDEQEAAPLFAEDPQHPPVAPLFEPEPFVRQQRAVFGRKAG